MAKVDIVVPCYNYGRFLRQCVESVLSQSISDTRVLIIDDASSDDSAAVAQSLSASDHRVFTAIHSRNLGHIKTYNEGIDWISSDYFLLLSADDLLVPGSLERAVRIMDHHPDVVLTCGKGVDWVNGSPIPQITQPNDSSWVLRNLIDEMCSTGTNLITTPTAIVRTSAQKRIGGYQVDLPHSGDMAMWLNFGAIGKVAHINAVQAIYRRHEANMSSSYYIDKLPDYQQRKAAFDSFFRKNQRELSNARELHDKAYRKLAGKAYWTGVGQFLRGRKTNANGLLGFATALNPRLQYLPPVAELVRTPHLSSTLISIASDIGSRILAPRKNSI